MNLRIFFDPVSTKVKDSVSLDPSSLYNHLIRYENVFPSLEYAEIAFIGLTETRGGEESENTAKAADAIREKLYALKKGLGAYRIIDLGNLRCGVSLEESYKRLKEVAEHLLSKNIVPVLLGSTHDMCLGLFSAYESTGKIISVTNIDACIDMQNTSPFANHKHVHELLTHEPNILFNYSHIGYQTYLTEQDTLNILEKLYFEPYRIGQVKKNIEHMEPVIRNADMLSFDINAIRQSDAPGHKTPHPFGLSGEEACQLCWYAGNSHVLSSIGIYEFDPNEDHKGQTASVIATMLWYFIEGFYSRVNDHDFDSHKFTKYYVNMSDAHSLVFYKHIYTGQWWLEVPFPEAKSNLARNSIVPCSYDDYLTANKGELPNRWILTHAKLL